ATTRLALPGPHGAVGPDLGTWPRGEAQHMEPWQCVSNRSNLAGGTNARMVGEKPLVMVRDSHVDRFHVDVGHLRLTYRRSAAGARGRPRSGRPSVGCNGQLGRFVTSEQFRLQ